MNNGILIFHETSTPCFTLMQILNGIFEQLWKEDELKPEFNHALPNELFEFNNF